nr:MAG TPA: hypothetical protein [Caudoviricetes sp.]DAX41546.1 MAG TPA: hypothetical protein [Caudoviricetes sp.]
MNIRPLPASCPIRTASGSICCIYFFMSYCDLDTTIFKKIYR